MVLFWRNFLTIAGNLFITHAYTKINDNRERATELLIYLYINMPDTKNAKSNLSLTHSSNLLLFMYLT